MLRVWGEKGCLTVELAEFLTLERFRDQERRRGNGEGNAQIRGRRGKRRRASSGEKVETLPTPLTDSVASDSHPVVQSVSH